MGMTWRSTMPLLSTLAALVIIVHSAEEDRGYRELRPRPVDTATYEQPWKAIDALPIHQLTRAEASLDSPEEEPPRRRPVRKRKRRPLAYPHPHPHPDSASAPAPAPQERHQQSIQGAYADHDQAIDPSKRRRKRPEHVNYHFTEQPPITEEIPLRRRGIRKKRPYYTEQIAEPVEYDYDEPSLQKKKPFFSYDIDTTVITETTDRTNNEEEQKIIQQGNKSILGASDSDSTSSDEGDSGINDMSQKIIHYAKTADATTLSAINAQSKTGSKANIDNTYGLINNPKQFKGVDAVILKQLLKRSNGSSLSEILQNHNLSLSDLLQGKQEAILTLNGGATYEPLLSYDTSQDSNSQSNGPESKYPTRRQALSNEKTAQTELSFDDDVKTPKSNMNDENEEPGISKHGIQPENQSRTSTKRRFPAGIRRKLRMRPTLNSTLKAQLSRDLIALSAKKYSNNNRNVTKSREWKDIVPMMPDRSKTEGDENSKDVVAELEPTTDSPAETTTPSLEVSNSSYTVATERIGSDVTNVKDKEVETVAITTTEATTTITIEIMPDEIMSEIEKPKLTPILRPAANNSTLRRQAFNNRLKRKRLKQKSSTTENPSDDLMMNFLGMANLVSASQFIERTQKPSTTIEMSNTETATELEDFLTTKARTVDEDVKPSSRYTTSTTPRSLPQTSTSTTQQTAKFEIQEILNDKMTKERLAKILRERNMTLSELVNHRERGSSHVHLADIFHNASKEPNPPEPFLTKSSIEPISKETYPLRAILEANTYETTTRIASSQADQNIQIPGAMNFGNNVNENSESMGIISLFNKLAENEVTIEKQEIRNDGTVSSVTSVNGTNASEGRDSKTWSDNEDWKELLTFMKTHNITTFEEDLQILDKDGEDKEFLEDLDSNGLIVLEDLRNLESLETESNSDDNTDTHDKGENLSEKPGILNSLPSNTKSVAIATASLLGLAAILFLLTYLAFKWRQQRNKLRKKESFCDGPIPSPVFESRKGHKNNSSSRSISPMISNTNIYMSTLETSGKESPDYMWTSLRKPFQ